MCWLILCWLDFQVWYVGVDIYLVVVGGLFLFDDGIDMVICCNDFVWLVGYYVEYLFVEWVGLVCWLDKVGVWFVLCCGGCVLKFDVVLLYMWIWLDVWYVWVVVVKQLVVNGCGQWFDYFYFSLQVVVVGFGVVIGLWYLVCDDIESGVLVVLMGFVEDGLDYYLLMLVLVVDGSVQVVLLGWLRGWV